MHVFRLALALAALGAGIPAASAEPLPPATLNPAQMFALAQRLDAASLSDGVKAVLEALTDDPDLVIRNEARFRLAQLLERQGDVRGAAVLLRRLIDEQPDAARARLELARLLVKLGDDAGARRELRQAQASGLPPDVARVVDRFQTALRSQAPFGGSFELAIAPDSNINRATSSTTIDGDIILGPDAVQQSGIGLLATGQGFARLGLGSGLNLLPRLSGAARLYRDGQFNDIAVDARIGLERVAGNGGRLTGSVGAEKRWFGGRLFTDTVSVSADWLRPVNRKAQVTVNAVIGRLRFARNSFQDGELYQLAGAYEFALGARSGGAVSVNGARQTAVDPGFASWSGGLSALAFRDVGRTTLFTTVSARRFAADEALFLFDAPRREWLVRGTIGGTFRQAAVRGLAPVLRVSVERNTSNIDLFRYTRVAVELGLGRAF